MQFNSYIYVLCFLPVVIVLYFLLNKLGKTMGKFILLMASLIFYTNFDMATAKVILISLIVNLLFAKVIEKSGTKQLQRTGMLLPVIINVSLLLYFKYTDFAITNVNTFLGKEYALKELVLPVGISFFTFQQIAYVVSVYKGEVPKVNVLDYLVYILYFPKILMGPLIPPIDFIDQLNDSERKKIDWDNVCRGIKIFSFGLFKKMMIADIFAKAVLWGYINYDVATSMDWILIMLFYTFQIYFDFSGYSDMAIGSSLMLNIALPINFDSPYKAVSIRDFWKRWHISLTGFFTRYIYIPLGGSRKGKLFTYVNIFIVFLISGIWHGANWTFILWGIIYGVLMIFDRVLERYEEKVFYPVRWGITFSVVNILWLLFRSDSIVQWKGILKKILLFQNTNFSDELADTFILPESPFIKNMLHIGKYSDGIRGFWMFLFLISAFGICLIPDNNYRNLKKISFVSILFAGIAFAWAVICMGEESVFVYFNF